MSILQACLLGALQGLTEFLPVSSSGHLVLLQRIFGIEESALVFDTALHIGTLFAVFIALRRDILSLLKKPFQKLTLMLIIATVPAVLAALLLGDTVDALFQSGAFLGPAFLFTALALTAAELLGKRKSLSIDTGISIDKITTPRALVIGLCQALALLPGVSRSGLTLAGSLAQGIKREDAARFSFLMSIPVILGALCLQIIKGGGESVPVIPLIVGTVTAFVFGLLSIKLMLKIVRERRLYGFALYTAALGVLCIVFQGAL